MLVAFSILSDSRSHVPLQRNYDIRLMFALKLLKFFLIFLLPLFTRIVETLPRQECGYPCDIRRALNNAISICTLNFDKIAMPLKVSLCLPSCYSYWLVLLQVLGFLNNVSYYPYKAYVSWRLHFSLLTCYHIYAIAIKYTFDCNAFEIKVLSWCPNFM